ncbi:MAG: sigma-70 family RNA polymerase sigma factor [Bacteroidota bacterium]
MNDIDFKELYESCSKYCMKTLLQWTNNEQDAEDAFAEAISIYWIRYKQGKIKNYSNPKAYILKTALNICRKKIKTDKRIINGAVKDFEEVIVIPDYLDEFNVKDTSKINQAFKKLSEDCQKMLTAKYVYGYKYEDIAEDMGRTSGNSVKVQTFRCTQYLLKLLDAFNNKTEQLG